MRKVQFSIFIPPKYEVRDGKNRLVEGTCKWDDEYSRTGYFHAWGLESPEEGSPNSIAIIEGEDGVVYTTQPTKVKFIDPI